MDTFVFVTNADPERPGLTFKVTIPSWAVEEWYDNNAILKRVRSTWVSDEELLALGLKPQKPNTSVTRLVEDRVVVETFMLSWADVLQLLSRADGYREPDTYKQGRPEKNVLVMTTSKERRVGAQNAKGSWY